MIVEVVPYNPNWAVEYEKEKKRLSQALGNVILKIHHIGSTSIKGLAAKPVIDMLLEVSSLESLDSVPRIFEGLGYEVMGEFGIEGRRYYRKGRDNRTHHVHAFKAGDPNVERHLAFRDYLATHADVMAEYARLKIELVKKYNHDNRAYCDGKDNFVKLHEAKALQWILDKEQRN